MLIADIGELPFILNVFVRAHNSNEINRSSNPLRSKTPQSAEKYVNNHALIAAINGRRESMFTARAYPQHEKYTVGEMYRRKGGARSVE